MLLTLAVINFLLAGFDAWLTRRRINAYGLFVEQNKAIVTLIAYVGVELGILLGIMVPTAALTALFLITHFQVGFALLVGFRLKLFVLQLQSIGFENSVRRIKNELGGRDKGATLPPESSDSETPISPSEDKHDRQS